MAINRVITCGRPGAERGAWLAATDCGVLTCGWVLAESLTDDAVTNFDACPLAAEHAMPAPLVLNVLWAEAALVFGDAADPESSEFASACRDAGRALLSVTSSSRASHVRDWISRHAPAGLVLCGGPAESTVPGTTDRVRRFLGAVLRGPRT